MYMAAAERCGDTQTVGRAVGRGDYKYVISRWHIKKGLNTRRHRFNGSGLVKKKQNGYGGDDEGQYILSRCPGRVFFVFFVFIMIIIIIVAHLVIFFHSIYILYSLDPLYRSQYIRLRLAGNHNIITSP